MVVLIYLLIGILIWMYCLKHDEEHTVEDEVDKLVDRVDKVEPIPEDLRYYYRGVFKFLVAIAFSLVWPYLLFKVYILDKFFKGK